MKKLIFLIFILAGTIIKANSEGIGMRIEVFDMIVGEYAFTGGNAIQLVIENKTDKDIILDTDNYLEFPSGVCWEIKHEGPMDKRCLKLKEEAVKIMIQPSLARIPRIKIPARGLKYFSVGPYDMSTPGRYSVSVAYNGEKAKEGFYKGKIKAEEKSFEVRMPEGIDLEILRLWERQNPDKPYCYFPLNMEPNIFF